jgi:hypothetical protein
LIFNDLTHLIFVNQFCLSISYRTGQRVYALKGVSWLLVNLLLFKHFVYQKDKHYILAANETTTAKSFPNSKPMPT